MWLHIGKFAAEQFLCARDRQFFDDIDAFAPAIVAAAGIAFSVFVCEHRALRFQHCARDDVFRRDELNIVLLSPKFFIDGASNRRIGFPERAREETAVSQTGRTRKKRHEILVAISRSAVPGPCFWWVYPQPFTKASASAPVRRSLALRLADADRRNPV